MGVIEATNQVSRPKGSAYEERAIYYVPSRAFDHGLPDVPVHVFERQLDQVLDPGTPTGIVLLDLSEALQLPHPATTPLILTRYCVVRAGETLSHRFAATGEVHYVLYGSGVSANGRDEIDWDAGDCFSFAGGEATSHRAVADSLLFSVGNEPELAYTHTVPRPEAPISAAVWRSARIEAMLAAVHDSAGPQQTAGRSISFSTPAINDLVSGAMLPTMMVAINSLEPGGTQRWHRHNSVAVTVAISGDGTYSIIGDQRVPWRRFGVMVTPPRLPHSHVNPGAEMMRSLVVQDGPLFYHCRSVGFEWLEDAPGPETEPPVPAE
jgi:gentisate 1,2-dioxygenase